LTEPQKEGLAAILGADLDTLKIPDLTENQLEILTAPQIVGLIKVLTEEQISWLTQKHFNSLEKQHMLWLLRHRLSDLPEQQIRWLTQEQLKGLTDNQIGGLTGSFRLGLTMQQITGLTDNQKDILNKQYYPPGMTTDQIACLVAEQIPALTEKRKRGKSPAQIEELRNTQIKEQIVKNLMKKIVETHKTNQKEAFNKEELDKRREEIMGKVNIKGAYPRQIFKFGGFVAFVSLSLLVVSMLFLTQVKIGHTGDGDGLSIALVVISFILWLVMLVLSLVSYDLVMNKEIIYYPIFGGDPFGSPYENKY
jgi:hypothetical protein